VHKGACQIQAFNRRNGVLRKESKAMLQFIVQGMFVPPPPQGPFWALLDQSAEGQELMQAMQKSMLDLVREMFEHEKVMIHLLKFAATSKACATWKPWSGRVNSASSGSSGAAAPARRSGRWPCSRSERAAAVGSTVRPGRSCR
jgi:hypothetical protein